MRNIMAQETMPFRQYGPWYRGGVSRSYIPASIFVSVGYAICLVFLAVFLILVGGIMTGVSYQKPDPRFDTEFFREHRSGINEVLRTVGPAFLGVGGALLAIAVTLCVVVACLASKQEKKRRNERQEHVEQPLQPPPASAYPHQPSPQNYSTTTGYPTQPVGQQFPGSNYPPQNQYPSQPANFYPSTAPYPPAYGSPYPPTDYPAPMTNMAMQNPQPIPLGNRPDADASKFS